MRLAFEKGERRKPMKKLAILALAGLMLVSAVGPFAAARELNDQTVCNINHVKCREYSLNLDAPWYKVTLMLTLCDIAFGKCALGL
jgi:hypothetical protein